MRDHELKDGIGRYGPCVNGKATSSSLVKKDGEYPWARITHLNVLKNNNCVEVLGNLYIQSRRGYREAVWQC